MPRPAAKSMEIQEPVENSGSLSSAPSLILPVGPNPITSMNSTTSATREPSSQPKCVTTQVCICGPIAPRFSGAMIAQPSTPMTSTAAAAKTTLSVGKWSLASSTSSPGISAGWIVRCPPAARRMVVWTLSGAFWSWILFSIWISESDSLSEARCLI